MPIFDDESSSPDGMPALFATYFSREAIPDTDPRDYVNAEARLTNAISYNWIHTLGGIVTSLITSGMTLDWLHEHAAVTWRMFHILVEDADGLYRWPTSPGCRWPSRSPPRAASEF
jgi:hypothetical protein